jgi:hypothetical protein
VTPKPHRFLDQDTTDEFLDAPAPAYEGRTAWQDRDAVDDLLERARRGEVTLPTLPPMIER